MNEPNNTGEKLDLRDEKGRFIEGAKGNPDGRPKGQKNYLTLLEEALEKQAEKEGVTFYDKLAEWCFRYPKTATAILKKFIPDKSQTEINTPEPVEIKIIYDDNTKGS
jgi:hypothetical protein